MKSITFNNYANFLRAGGTFPWEGKKAVWDWISSGQVQALSRGEQKIPVCQVWRFVGLRSLSVMQCLNSGREPYIPFSFSSPFWRSKLCIKQPPPFWPLCPIGALL